MKKSYETPSIEVVKFHYRDQIVVASGSNICEFKRVDNPQGCNEVDVGWISDPPNT